LKIWLKQLSNPFSERRLSNQLTWLNPAAWGSRGDGREAFFGDALMADRNNGSMSGLTHGEAKEFHSVLMTSILGFVAASFVAHVLVWMWRPFF
jgi:light-harvesting complex 1 beta chain